MRYHNSPFYKFVGAVMGVFWIVAIVVSIIGIARML